jgi:hypothetical protein
MRSDPSMELKMKKSVKTNAKVTRQLYIMTRERLFGEGPWRADRKTAVALNRQFIEMGLYERVPGKAETLRSTDLGKELKADLMMVFMGAWDLFETPEILDMHDMISREKSIKLRDQFEDGDQFVPVVLPYVQQAFREYFKTDANQSAGCKPDRSGRSPD